MNAVVLIENVKILKIVAKESEDKSIRWNELVFMQESDINTVVVKPEIAEQLEVNNEYDLVMTITEQLKATSNGHAYKNHKFKVISAYDTDK